MGDELGAYTRALQSLFARTTGRSKFGLERTEALLGALGDPHKKFDVFHVAGTNGKGSVCATLEAALRSHGLRVGKYTSPHLVDFRERFLVDGAAVDAAYVTRFIEQWTPTVERLGATFFEATTAMAFALFAEREIDVAVVEAGLGGRLDSTNVVQPIVAGVTSIGIDHTEYLGESREQIAREKAGIFKSGAAAVIGEQDADISDQLVRMAQAAASAPIVSVRERYAPTRIHLSASGTRFSIAHDAEWHTPLIGEHQAWNAATAIAMLDASGPRYARDSESLRRSLARVRLPGRFQRVAGFIFDVAHNPDGAHVLARTLREVALPRPLCALLCVLADKDWRGVMQELSGVVDNFLLTMAPTAPASRAWHPDEALRYAQSNGWDAQVEEDFDHALERARTLGKTVLITGSFHTVGDAMVRLQVDPIAG
ncbi:MAG TPA: folylpolyglutamate synthase/dihydrofolate synthase family protein [Gemmatimonadaceae bacterium]